jgi:hypothetical protein
VVSVETRRVTTNHNKVSTLEYMELLCSLTRIFIKSESDDNIFRSG